MYMHTHACVCCLVVVVVVGGGGCRCVDVAEGRDQFKTQILLLINFQKTQRWSWLYSERNRAWNRFYFWKKKERCRVELEPTGVLLRGAWRDHCFPEPFSWFLHETGLESLKITSARCFLLLCRRKDSKKRKNTAGFMASLGAGVQPRSTVQLFMPVSGVEKTPFWQFFLGFGVSFGEEMPFVNSNASF